MKIKILEHRENGFVEQLRQLLTNSTFMISNIPLFKVNYYLGEDEDSGTRGLFFNIEGKNIGDIFSTYKNMEPFEVPYDIEEQFIVETMNTLLLSGCNWFNLERIKKLSQVGAIKTTVSDRVICLN